MENYKKWLAYENLDPILKKELLSLNETDIKERFQTNLSFGTGGLRGLMGVGTNRVNIYTIRKASLGFGNYLIKNNLLNGVAISYDNRFLSKEFAYETAKVLASLNIKSYIFKNLRPTPMLSFAVRYFQASGGVMITASHNPKEYNGYKVYNSTGAQVNLNEADKIIQEMDLIDDLFAISTKESDLITWIDDKIDDIYLDLVKTIKVKETTKPLKIVYSPLHGTGGTVIPKLLENEGYQVFPLAKQMVVDPNFSNTTSSNPEEKNAYLNSIKYASSIKAELVLVTDPDADRLGVSVLHNNEYVYLTGNQTAAIELYYLLSNKKNIKNGYVFTTNVTTDLIKTIASFYKVNVIETLTGFKFIGEKTEELKPDETYVFGCEESYGSLIKDFVRDKDAVQAVYLLAEIANVLANDQMTLIDLLEEIYKKFGYFEENTISITLPGLAGLKKIDEIMNYFRSNPLHLNGFDLIGYDDLSKGIECKNNVVTSSKLPTANVLKYYFTDNTWVVFRPSGTEPKIKLYFATKGNSKEVALSRISKISQEVKEMINKI